MKIEKIRRVGDCLTERLTGVDKERLIKLFGEPNTTDLDDLDKVNASWGLMLEDNFVSIWSYKESGNYGKWSVYSEGNGFRLLQALLGE